MTERRRIYSFPGGVLEINDYGEADTGGVYLEWRAGETFEPFPEPPAHHELPDHDADERRGA